MTAPAGAARRIAVVVTAAAPERAREALRAAVGLGLRGDRVEVILTGAAAALAGGGDPAIARAVATLAELGQRVALGGGEIAACVRAADAIEVWT